MARQSRLNEGIERTPTLVIDTAGGWPEILCELTLTAYYI